MAGIRCPKCKGITIVIDTRICTDGRILRRRKCLNKNVCGVKFSTRETIITNSIINKGEFSKFTAKKYKQ